jgi:hypothetical protein
LWQVVRKDVALESAFEVALGREAVFVQLDVLRQAVHSVGRVAAAQEDSYWRKKVNPIDIVLQFVSHLF